MEFALNRHRSIIGVLSQLFYRKGDNIFYEKVESVGNWTAVFSYISSELGRIKDYGIALTIIDPYFLNVETADAENYAGAFIDLLKTNGIVRVNIYADDGVATHRSKKHTRNCENFKRILTNIRGGIRIEYNAIPEDIHDRFWITNALTGLVVGASFNGLGKKLSMIYEISQDDMDILDKELQDRHIICRMDLS